MRPHVLPYWVLMPVVQTTTDEGLKRAEEVACTMYTMQELAEELTHFSIDGTVFRLANEELSAICQIKHDTLLEFQFS